MRIARRVTGQARSRHFRWHSDAQIETLQRWIKQGLAEGDPAHRHAPPSFRDGWQLGTPDVVATTFQPFLLAPQANDVYRNLVVRTSVPATRFVRAVEFKTNADAALRKSLALNPDYVDAPVNLGVSLLSRRRTEEALTHFRAAARLQPESAVMHSNLGGALLAAGLDPRYAPAVDNLRRLNAMGMR